MRETNKSSRLLFVGDIALGNHPKRPGFGFFSKYKDGIPLQKAKEIFPSDLSADVIFGNLEFVLEDDDLHPGTYICCLGGVSFVPWLKECGFTVLNIANNHALDYGKDVFYKTINYVEEYGIKVIGVPKDNEPNEFININGKKYAFLGCSMHPEQNELLSDFLNVFSEKEMIERIKSAAKHSDIVCVSVHWGDEFLPVVSSLEKQIARNMIDAGAAVVVGHHPHVLREVERYKNGVIAYSLGNFIGDMTWNRLTRNTGCLSVEVNHAGAIASRFYPAAINSDFFPSYYDEKFYPRFFRLLEQERQKWNMRLDSVGYNSIAKEALIKNQWVTILFFLRNIFQYKLTMIKNIVVHGVSARLLKSSEKNKS